MSADWRLLPELVEQALQPHVLRVARPARNGAAYLMVVGADSGDALVACQSDASGGAALSQYDALVGARIDWTAATARIFVAPTADDVTNLPFPPRASYGYEFALADACELLVQSGVYNTDVPTLDQLDEDAREEIIRTNRQAVS